ncbi:MAG: hypothetical protein RLY47_525 [Candidatus Parcubacteria bacterium]|jgi:hypothetical protein
MVQKKSSGAGVAVAVGASAAALGAAAYYLFGPQGKQHRVKAQGWMIKMKGEVIERLEDLKEVSEPVYNQVVEAVATKYAKESKTSKKDILALAADLKKGWRSIVASTQSKKKPARKTKPVMKKAAKKTK